MDFTRSTSVLLILCTSFIGSMATPTCLNPVTNFDPLVQYFPQNSRLVATDLETGEEENDPDSATVQFAELFEVTYHSSYKVVKTTIPGKPSREFVLYQCGTPKPESDAFWSNATFFKVPVSKAATGGSIPAAFLEDLGLDHRLHIVDGAIISSSCILKQTSVCEGINHFSVGSAPYPDYNPDETMVAWRNEIETNDEIGVVFTDSFGVGESQTDKDVAFDASLDKGILKTAEWLKFVSLFFNAEAKANEVFQEEVEQVKAISEKVASDVGDKLTVAWAQTSYLFDIYGSDYRKEFITFGGGLNAFEEGVKPANISHMMDALKEVQVLIDETYSADPREYTKAKFMEQYSITEEMIASGDWPFLTNELVFRTDKHHGDGTYDSAYGGKSYPLEWFARRNTNPNEFVSDVAYALYPTVFPQYSDTYFLRNIMKDETTIMNTAADCAEDCATDSPTVSPMPGSTAAPTGPAGRSGAYGSSAGKERVTVLHLMMASFALAVARFL